MRRRTADDCHSCSARSTVTPHRAVVSRPFCQQRGHLLHRCLCERGNCVLSGAVSPPGVAASTHFGTRGRRRPERQVYKVGQPSPGFCTPRARGGRASINFRVLYQLIKACDVRSTRRLRRAKKTGIDREKFDFSADFRSVREGLGTCSGRLKAVTGDLDARRLSLADRRCERAYARPRHSLLPRPR